MNVRHATVSVILLVLLIALPGLAEAQQSGSCSALVDEMLALKGLSDRLQNSLDENLSTLGQSDSAEWDRGYADIFRQEFAPKRILSSVRMRFLQHCESEFFRSVIEQLQSPAVKSVVQAERQSVLQQLHDPVLNERRDLSSHGPRDKRTQFERELKARPPSDERLALINDLDRALKLTDNAVEVNVDAWISTLQGAHCNCDVKDNDVELSTASWRSSHRKAIRALNLFIYRDLTDDQLQAFIELSKRDPLRKFNTQLNEYLNDALRQGAARIAERGRTLYEQVKAKNER